MQRDILKFQANMPATVQLDKGPEGKEVQGRYGLEYQYTCNGNSTVMWLPPQGRAALLRAGAQAGDIVEILKTFRGEAAIFDVRLLSNATGPTHAQAPAGPRLHVNGKTYDMARTDTVRPLRRRTTRRRRNLQHVPQLRPLVQPGSI